MASGIEAVDDCAACGDRLAEPYFEINRTIVCEPCRRSIESQFRGGPAFRRFLRAGLFGLIASMIGSLVYAVFLSIASFDWSIVAVLDGFLVGKMVRKGSRGLGGWSCRWLAVGLTYASLVMAFVWLGLGALWQQDPAGPAIPINAQVVRQLLEQAILMPLVRFKGAPIQVVFIGFALWQAWRLNKPRRLIVTGPHPANH